MIHIKTFSNFNDNYLSINEQITSGSVTVYHRTTKMPKSYSPFYYDIHSKPLIDKLKANGYKTNIGNLYGYGIYTTYDFESQLTEYMDTYGPIVIENKILSLDGYLIFDYDIAKKIYGKNYTLDNQLKLIVGKDCKDFLKSEEYLNVITELQNKKYTSVSAKIFIDSVIKTKIFHKIKGIIFTGENDGRVLVCYDKKNIEPIKYTEDDGKTWINIIDKSIYSRSKNFEKKDAIISHIINKIDNYLEDNLTLEESEYFLKNINYFIKECDLNDDLIYKLIICSDKPDILIKKLSKKGTDYINNLENYYYLLGSINPEKIISYFKDISIDVLDYIDNTDKVIDTIIKSLNVKSIVDIFFTNNRINKIIKNIDVNELCIKIEKKWNSYNIDSERFKLIIDSFNKYNIDLLSNISDKSISYILRIINPSGIIKILLEHNKVIPFKSIADLLSFHDTKKIIESLGKYKEEFLEFLSSDDDCMYKILRNSSCHPKIIEYLSQYYKLNLNKEIFYKLYFYYSKLEKVISILENQNIIKSIKNLDSEKLHELIKLNPKENKEALDNHNIKY